MLCFILLITFVVSHLPLSSSPYNQGTVARHREFEVDTLEQNLTIQPNTFQSINYNLQDSEEFEVGYI